MSLEQLACRRIRELTPYQSARRIGGKGRIYLNANESPEGFDFTLSASSLNRYPDCQPEELISAYAAYAGVPRERILAGRGSDEIIGLLCRAFCEPGQEKILICPPTYGMYAIAAETNGIGVVRIPPLADGQPDADRILPAVDQEKVKIIFLCSPNNPTGTLLDREILQRILRETAGRALVVVDEAYIEFAPDHTSISLLDQFPHLVVTRTMSKAFGLAGLRCGFALGDPEVISVLLKVIDPYPVCTPVAQIAAAALSGQGIGIMRDRVARLNTIRDKFADACRTIPCVREVFASHGNYVLLRFTDGARIFSAAREAGYILRDFGDKPGLGDCVRITVGTEAEMAEILAFLRRQS